MKLFLRFVIFAGASPKAILRHPFVVAWSLVSPLVNWIRTMPTRYRYWRKAFVKCDVCGKTFNHLAGGSSICPACYEKEDQHHDK